MICNEFKGFDKMSIVDKNDLALNNHITESGSHCS